jgi:hypothetical protein
MDWPLRVPKKKANKKGAYFVSALGTVSMAWIWKGNIGGEGGEGKNEKIEVKKRKRKTKEGGKQERKGEDKRSR